LLQKIELDCNKIQKFYKQTDDKNLPQNCQFILLISCTFLIKNIWLRWEEFQYLISKNVQPELITLESLALKDTKAGLKQNS